MELLFLILLIISGIINLVLWLFVKKIVNISSLFEYNLSLLEEWVAKIKKDVENAYLSLKDVDKSGIFEKDDSVGFIFNDILNIILDLNIKINQYNNIQKTDQISNNDKANNNEQPIRQPNIKHSHSFFNKEDEKQIESYLSKKSSRNTNSSQNK